MRQIGTAAATTMLATGLLLVGPTPASAAPPVTDWAGLTAAFAAGGTVQLGADISQVDAQLAVPNGVAVVLDLNGHDLSVVNSLVQQAAVRVHETGDLTVSDSVGTGTLTARATNDGAGGAGIGGDYFGPAGSITIASGTVNASGGFYGAGIGSSGSTTVGSVTVTGGTVTAEGGNGAAGIGGSTFAPGSNNPHTGAITISGGIVVATGGPVSAGIGGGQGQPNGPITISGGQITANGGDNGPGIGSGYQSTNPDGPTVFGDQITISGGTVDATGAIYGAGIGGGAVAGGSPVSIAGGTVNASSGALAPAIGGGWRGSGSTVDISSGATVTVGGDAAFGEYQGPAWGSFSNAGTVTVTAGTPFEVPAGVTAVNTGTINLDGTLTGAGTVTNSGRIIAPVGRVSGNGQGGAGNLLVTVHNYLLGFDLNDVAGTPPADLPVFTTSLDDAGLALPDPTELPGHTFTGWYTAETGGNRIVDATDLSDRYGSDGPVNPTLYAHWIISQVITFTSTAPTAPVVGDTYSATATGGGSGNPVTFSTSTPATCSVAGSTVTFSHVGDCTIVADQAAGGFYLAAPSVSQTVAVGKAAQSIIFTSTPPADAAVGGSYTVAATGGGSGLPVTFTSGTPAVCSVDDATVTFLRADTCAVIAHQAGNADYLVAADQSQNIAIGKAAQAITFTSTPPTDATVEGSYTVAATGGGSGNPVTFSSTAPSVCSVSGVTVTFEHAGACAIAADQAGNADYAPAPTQSQHIDVGKAAQSITFTSTPPTDAAVEGSYTVAATGGGSGLPVTFTTGTRGVCSVSGSTVTFLKANTCAVFAHQAGNDDYFAAAEETQSITVGKAAQSITFTSTPPADAAVGTSYEVTAIGGSSGLPVTFASGTPAVCAVSASIVTFEHVGACTVVADQAGNADYSPAPSQTQTIGVGQAAQAITFTSTPPADAAVGGSYTVTATGGGSGNPVTFSSGSPAVCSVSGAEVTFDHAGDCLVAADQAGDDDHTAATTSTQAVTVAKAAQAISFTTTIPAAPVVGDGYQIAATGGGSGNPVTFSSAAPEVCTVTGGTVTGSTVTFDHAGDCLVGADQAGNDDYTAAPTNSQATTVGKAGQAISFTTTIPAAPVVGDEYQIAATSGLSGGPAALAAVDVSGGGSGNPVTLAAADGSGNPITFTSVTPSVCTVAESTVTFDHTGDCVVDADQAGNDDYTAAPTTSQSTTVGKAPQEISFTTTIPAAPVVGDEYQIAATGGGSGNPVTFTSQTPAVCTVAGGAVTFDHAGDCLVDADQAGNDDYTAASALSQSTTIGKAAQRISITSRAPRAPVAGDTYRVAATGGNSGNPVTYSSNTPAVCTVSKSTVTFTRAGDCVVKADQAGNDDYADAPSVPEGVTVAKTAQAITIASPPKDAKAGDIYEPEATGGPSGRPVVVSIDPSSDPSTCTVHNGTVTFTGAGVCVVKLTQAGDDGYLPSSVRQSVTVAAGVVDIGPDADLPTGRTGLGFSAVLTADGGLGPYGWAITDGTLPPGLTLDPETGLIAGIPSEAGDFTFTVTVTDSESPAVRASATYTISITTDAGPPPPNPAPGPGSAPSPPDLAATGVDAAPIAALGLLLLLAGLALVGLTRPRPRRTATQR